jgi:N-acylneuraminate cytidylyltransferase
MEAWVRSNEGDFENFLSLPCTAPLRTKENVYSCFKKISNTEPFIVSVTPAKFNPFFNLVKKDSFDSSITLVNQAQYHRRQDAPQIFAITPISYIAKPDEIMQREKIWDGKVFGVEVPASNAVDIDDINDFTYAEYLFKKRLSQN